jgi:polysaccharide export outer membrane protein
MLILKQLQKLAFDRVKAPGFDRSQTGPYCLCIKLLLLFLLVLMVACTNPPYRGRDVLGADEFVMDSYKIREGKLSILQMEGKSSEELSTAMLEDYEDTIHDGDILQVAINHPSRKDLAESVDQIGQTVGFSVTNGMLQLPDLEPIEVDGLTLGEARALIQERYREQIRGIDVFLAYKDRKERKVELAGLVSVPSVPVDGKRRLFETLAIAKVPTNANLFKSYVVRENQMLPVDLYKLLKEGDMKQNVVMRGGDKVYIADPCASNLMVLGEVGKEGIFGIPDGFMTLRQALAEAGGITSSGDRSYIQVIRGNIQHPKIYTLNWQHVVRLPNDSMLLIPGDIVYVAATPVTEWNRFVNQLLPTFIALDLITRGVRGIDISP